MPAIITHHLFGEDAAKLLPEGVLSGEEELLAFLLGNQGPDPYFSCFSTLPERATRCHRFAARMHDEKIVEAFWAMREAVRHLREEDARVGMAFVLGFLGHYALDSTAHPMVYAQEAALGQADPELVRAAEDVHAVIESDLDVWMLRELRGQTVADVATSSFLAHTDRVLRVAGALLAQVALQVFDEEVGVGEYACAVADYQFLYRAIDPAENPVMRLGATLERLARPHSHLRAMAHHLSVDEDCPSANLARRAWVDPKDGATRTESFPDLYHEALERWDRLVRPLVQGDRAAFELACGDRNYNGR